MAKRDGFDLETAAKAFVSSKLSVGDDDVHYNSGYSGDVTHHAFVRQKAVRATVLGHHAYQAHVLHRMALPSPTLLPTWPSTRMGRSQHSALPSSTPVSSMSALAYTVVTPPQAAIAPSTPSVSLEDAIKTAEAALGAPVNDHPAALQYLALQDGSVALTHVVQIQDNDNGIWVEAFVDAHNNKLLSIVNFVTKLTVCVYVSSQYLRVLTTRLRAVPCSPGR